MTLGGIEMKSEMYERNTLKFKFLDGKGNLEKSLEGSLRFPMILVTFQVLIPARDTKKTKYMI